MQKKKSLKLVNPLSYFLILATLLLAATNGLAKNDQDTCKQIIVVGDVNWPPYAMQDYLAAESSNLLTEPAIDGIAIELVRKIFAELDLPIQVVKLDSKRNILNGLQLGDIDVLVSTYKNNEIEEAADLITPGYLYDPIAVYMRKGYGTGIHRWDDLIGKRGVMSDHFAFNEKFGSYATRYLYVHAKGSLSTVINMVNEQKADYVIGSRLQLEHGVKHANLLEDMELLATVSEPDEVHMGFSKNSLCRTYLPYLRRRLLEMKEDGSINDIVTHYLAKDNVKAADDAATTATPEAGAASAAKAGKNPAGFISDNEELQRQVVFELQPEQKIQEQQTNQTEVSTPEATTDDAQTAAAAEAPELAQEKVVAQPTQHGLVEKKPAEPPQFIESANITPPR